ncbi:MAG TPA: hypothetical protein VF535_16500 [Allosphingosinicella sp.]
MLLAFVLVFYAPPILLAFAAGFTLERRPVVIGIASVAVLALLLMATSPHSFFSMLPFIGLVGGIALIPSIIAALIGSKIRSRFKKEA